MKARKINAIGIKGLTACVLIATTAWTTSQEEVVAVDKISQEQVVIASQEEIAAIGTASQHKRYAVELALTNFKDKNTGHPLTLDVKSEVRYSRQRLDNGKKEDLPRQYNASTFFDRSAEVGVRYRYTAFVRFTPDYPWREVVTSFPIIGLRPVEGSHTSGAKLTFINATLQEDSIELSWIFDELEGLDLNRLRYEIFIGGSDNCKGWLSGMETKYSSSKYKLGYSCTESKLNLPRLSNTENLGVCILATAGEVMTRCFCTEVNIEKAKGTRAATEPSLIDIQQIKLEDEVRQIDALQADKSYGLSFIPERRTLLKSKLPYLVFDHRADHMETNIILDSLITIMEGLNHLKRTDEEKNNDCLKSALLDSTSFNKNGGIRKPAYAYWSRCIDYELNSLKIEIQKDSCHQERCISVSPNKYTLITKYQMTSGKYVWMELPKEEQLSENLIKNLQRKLQERGYYHGLINGKFNTRLRLAILNYQQKEKMPIGNLDLSIISHLGLELD